MNNKCYAYRKYVKEIKKLKEEFLSDYMNSADKVLFKTAQEYSLELDEFKEFIIFVLRRKLK